MPRPRLASARPMAGVFVLFLVLATVDPVPDPRLEPAAVEGQAFLGPAHRLADIERLRQHLGIAYWLVWCRFVGVTPGLAYAWAGAELHLVRAGHGAGEDMLTASWMRAQQVRAVGVMLSFELHAPDACTRTCIFARRTCPCCEA